MTKIKTKPLGYRQWGQIKKEMYRLVLAIALLVAINTIIYFGSLTAFTLLQK